MKIKDIRLLSKEVRKNYGDKYSAEFAYVLANKIKQPVYKSKRGNKTKYFVGYFNYGEIKEIKIADINKVMVTDKVDNYERINLKSIEEDLNYEMVDYFKDILSESFTKKLVKTVDEYRIVLYENDIYTTDLPFRRDILIVSHNETIAGIAYVSGLRFQKEKARLVMEDQIESLVGNNSDCKRMLKKEKCPYMVLENYIGEFYTHSFIDSIFIKPEYRGIGIGTKVYELLFRLFNKDEINLTSCIKEIQTEEAKGLWDKIKKKFPDNYYEDDDFIYLKF